MKEYATPFAERERLSRYKVERYWTDPDFRLAKINHWRVARGMAPYADASEIPTRGRRAA